MTSSTIATEILARLKANVAEADLLRAKERRITAHIYVDAYAWVETMTVSGHYQGSTEALKDLAGTLRKTYPCVRGWYHNGLFMRNNSISPDGVAPFGVETLRCNQHHLPKSYFLKALSQVKEGQDGGKVSRTVRQGLAKSTKGMERGALNIVTASRQRGRMDKAEIKLRALALRLLCKEVLHREVDVAVCDHRTGEVIINIPEDE